MVNFLLVFVLFVKYFYFPLKKYDIQGLFLSCRILNDFVNRLPNLENKKDTRDLQVGCDAAAVIKAASERLRDSVGILMATLLCRR